jgi:hypothetical protein
VSISQNSHVARIFHAANEAFIQNVGLVCEHRGKACAFSLVICQRETETEIERHGDRETGRQGGRERTEMPQVPIMALTATAVPRVRDDIMASLELADPFISSRFSPPHFAPAAPQA